jgi:hypothetical protein
MLSSMLGFPLSRVNHLASKQETKKAPAQANGLLHNASAFCAEFFVEFEDAVGGPGPTETGGLLAPFEDQLFP